MQLKRPTTPTPCLPVGYVRDREIILDAVRDAIQARRWECRDLHLHYPSIRRKTFEAVLDGDYNRFSMRFAYSIAEAVGVSPARALAAGPARHRSLDMAA